MASYPSGSRGRFAKPLFTGSNPVDASNLRFAMIRRRLCPGGEIGRHKGLKIPRPIWACRFKSDPGYLCFHDEKDSSLFHKLRKHVLFINYQILQILCNETGYRMGYRPHSPKPATFPCFYVISQLTQNR